MGIDNSCFDISNWNQFLPLWVAQTFSIVSAEKWGMSHCTMFVAMIVLLDCNNLHVEKGGAWGSGSILANYCKTQVVNQLTIHLC
jgi:hypothetical protein